MPEIKYFVSYERDAVGGGISFGRCIITRDNPITCIEDIEGMEKSLNEKHPYHTHVILNWRRFEDVCTV